MTSMFYTIKWTKGLSTDHIIKCLKEKNLMPAKIDCPSCSGDMVVHKDVSRKDHFRWVCKDRNCRKRKPIRAYSWATNYKIPFTDLYVLLRYYVENTNIAIISERTQIDTITINEFYKDLDGYIPIYLKKFIEIIKTCEYNLDLKIKYEYCKHNFREFSKLFTYSAVFNIIHDTLQHGN
jgi:transposase-like protein